MTNHVCRADASKLGDIVASFPGMVTLAYIDPPFNTGHEFRNYSDRMQHDDWLKMMRECLGSIRDTLTPDGSVWIHLDDNMAAYCRVLADEVFGAGHHVATIVWRKRYRAGGQNRAFCTVHNSIIVISRNELWTRRRGLPPNPMHTGKYKNPDNDPNGRWRLSVVGKRIYLSELIANGSMPHTWWDYDEAGHNEMATKESRTLFGGEGFSYPKPEILLERILTIGSNPGDRVFDPFGGSGTTAAVAARMDRQFVTSEIRQETIDQFIRPRLNAQGVQYTYTDLL